MPATQETWKTIEGKMLELRILTDANWKDSEWELAALGERVLRTVETAKFESKRMRADAEQLQSSIECLKAERNFKKIFCPEM